jgi:hypothetical protein
MKGEQLCRICASVDRDRIEAAISARVGYREIAVKFHTSPSALSRHKAHMVGPGELADTPKGVIATADAAIQELRVLGRRARKHKDRIRGVALALSVSRELRSWLQLRSQLARRQPAGPNELTEPEVEDAELKRMAEVYLQRHGEKPN